MISYIMMGFITSVLRKPVNDQVWTKRSPTQINLRLPLAFWITIPSLKSYFLGCNICHSQASFSCCLRLQWLSFLWCHITHLGSTSMVAGVKQTGLWQPWCRLLPKGATELLLAGSHTQRAPSLSLEGYRSSLESLLWGCDQATLSILQWCRSPATADPGDAEMWLHVPWKRLSRTLWFPIVLWLARVKML